MDDDFDDGFEPLRKLLRNRLAASGLSARKAAEMMPIGDTRLRQILKGYQPIGRGQKIQVVAPDGTMADIAIALAVQPEEVEAIGFPSVAREMRRRIDAMDAQRPDQRDYGQILAEFEEIEEWAREGIGMEMPPDALLQLFEDNQLLEELARRLHERVETLEAFDRHLATHESDELSDAADRPNLAIAAHDEGSIAGEQESRNDT